MWCSPIVNKASERRWPKGSSPIHPKFIPLCFAPLPESTRGFKNLVVFREDEHSGNDEGSRLLAVQQIRASSLRRAAINTETLLVDCEQPLMEIPRSEVV
jgi:hypothetical protein